MAFLREVKMCSKLDLIRNKGIREELKFFNLNEKLRLQTRVERTLRKNCLLYTSRCV